MHYHLYYFSGTGNTEHAVHIIENNLTENGHTVEKQYINTTTKPLDSTPDRVILAFPTYSFQPPAIVLKFISRLPKNRGRKAAVLAVAGGGAYTAPWTARNYLKRRAYNVFISACANYPQNWTQIIEPDSGEKMQEMIDNGDKMVMDFTNALLEDKPESLNSQNAAYPFMAFLCKLFLLFGRRFLGKLFIADNDCTSCGLCIKHCPAAAIKMSRKKVPYWKFNCESCNRCINICPTKAINTSIARGIILTAFIVFCCILFVKIFSQYTVPAIAILPSTIVVIFKIIGYTITIGLGHFIPLAVIDPLVLVPIQQSKYGKIISEKCFTKKFNRYTYQGYRPPNEQKT